MPLVLNIKKRFSTFFSPVEIVHLSGKSTVEPTILIHSIYRTVVIVKRF